MLALWLVYTRKDKYGNITTNYEMKNVGKYLLHDHKPFTPVY